MIKPVIKWSGSKRSQASNIISYFPNEIETYYEPFCGGGSVMGTLLFESDIKPKHIICSDLNNDLISLFNKIKSEPLEVFKRYNEMWLLLNKDEDKALKRTYFEKIRKEFNETHDPYMFMFIMRTTTNGMPRYNKKGEFNNSFHITRNGIIPNTLEKIIYDWSSMLNKNNVEFINCSFDALKPTVNDFIYLDPPYILSKGMYFGNFDNNKLWDWLRNIECDYIMSYDGISGEIDNTYEVPTDLYSKHIYLKSGNSSFKRTIGKSNDSIVYESLYIKNK